MNTAKPRSLMLTLIAKDLRVFRTPLIGLILLGVAAYAFFGVWITTLNSWRETRTSDWFEALGAGAMMGLGLSALVASAFGGMSIAGERTDRTALFMAMLPVRRGQILFSKAVAGGMLILGVMLIHLAIAILAFLTASRVSGGSVAEMASFVRQIAKPTLLAFPMAYCCFSVAWLAGTFIRSAAISAAPRSRWSSRWFWRSS
ncbi:MAG: ABC transporter permease [Tepidisphaeraceae bacterium]